MTRSLSSPILLACCLLPLGAFASTNAKTSQADPHFIREGGQWLQVDAAGKRWTVDPRVISLRWKGQLQDLPSLRLHLQARGDSLLALAQGMSVVRSNRLGIADLRLPEGTDPVDAVRRLEESGLFEFVTTNTFGEWLGQPNDPSYSAQWSLNNTGQSGGTPGADIGAEAAWDISAGDPSILIAVIDSGTDVFHADLATNRYENPGEIVNGVDDDGNGLIDDIYGWDFENNNNDVTSNTGHGTQVAGILGARSDNSQGIAGLAGGFGAQDGCTFIPCAVGSSFPIGSVIDDAILYAADQGASVITMSLGVGQSAAINAALDYAVNTKGVFVNCASGNIPGNNIVGYPASNPNVIAVGSTDKSDNISSFSSGGPELWIVAPGELILSTSLFGTYANSTGTSFSSPHIAAIAGLMLSVNPSLTPAEIAEIMKDTATDVGAPGYDVMAGWGRADAAAAVAQAAASCGISNHCASNANSTNLAALISATGTTSVAANDLVLSAGSLPLQQNGIFYYGPDEAQVPFGVGFGCVAGPFQRLPIVNSGQNGTATFNLDVTNPPQVSGQITAGSTWSFQYWYRDPTAGGVAFNTSDGLTVSFCP